MFRVLLAGVFAAGLVTAAGLPGTLAQDKKKEAPKKKERIALNEPTAVAKDPDFAIQGEYVGKQGDGNVGAQVIARGLGEFEIKFTVGGLPGDGWDGKATPKATAKRGEDGAVAITGKDITGNIADGKLTIKTPTSSAVLAKVERKSNTLGKAAPEGAAVLFGKEGDEKNWDGGKIVELSDGKFLNMGVKSKEKFQGFTAHIEFRLPWMPNSTGQGRGNSGVYLQDRYECQVLDSFGLNGENNECGGIYTQHKPSVNMCYPPMTWQTYDIEFTPAQFGEDGKKTKNGRATIYHNGVKIHDNIEFPKECPGGQKEAATPGPFQFQNHGDPVVYRNVWVVPAK
ncbi:MAG: DUF1080 domain-containing protein [Gemmataceae bacterium]